MSRAENRPDGEATLSGFEWVGDQEPEPEPEPPQEPRTEPLRPDVCQGCGGHVTPDYRRVRGLDGNVYACPNCPTEHEHSPEEIAGLRTIGGSGGER